MRLGPGIRLHQPPKAAVSNLAVLSLKNRALIALITIVAAVFGGLALTNLKQELIPSIEFPGLIVVSTYPGASPEVVVSGQLGPHGIALRGGRVYWTDVIEGALKSATVGEAAPWRWPASMAT